MQSSLGLSLGFSGVEYIQYHEELTSAQLEKPILTSCLRASASHRNPA